MRNGRLTLLILLSLVLGAGGSVGDPRAAGSSEVNLIVNGGFEDNSGCWSERLTGWTIVSTYYGSWYAQCGRNGPRFCSDGPFPGDGRLLPPPEGFFAAAVDRDLPGRDLLFQEITIPWGGRARLQFLLWHVPGIWKSPKTWSFTGGDNRQFRVDLMSTSSSVTAYSSGVLANIYRTESAMGALHGFKTVSKDLTEFSGQTVRLRFGSVSNTQCLNVVVDDVKLLFTPRVVMTPMEGLSTSEDGGMDSFDVVLAAQPLADVVINLSSSNVEEATVAPSSLTFTPVAWNEPQPVTVVGVDDGIADGDQPFTIITSDTSSTDPAFDGIPLADVSGMNIDDEPKFVVEPVAGLTTAESGSTDHFTISLSLEPTADVTVSLSSSDPSEGNVDPSSVTFTVGDWSVPQVVTVTGVDDDLPDGDQPYMIITTDAISIDSNFDGAVVDDVEVTNLDNETSASDLDGDAVPNDVEQNGPNGGDGNGDGLPDSTQSLVASFPSGNGNGYITLSSTCHLRDVHASVKDELEPTPLSFPYGLVGFRMLCPTSHLTVLYHAGSGWKPGEAYWKFGPEVPGQAPTVKWYRLPGVTFDTTVVGGTTVARASFTLNDGQLGDDSGSDGEIVDQGGPGAPGPLEKIPATSGWILLMMAVTLAVMGAWRLS